MRRLRTALLALFAATAPVWADVTDVRILSFDDLNGWADDNHADALEAFRSTCPDMTQPDWHTLCALALNPTNPKTFFELFFRPVLISNGDDPLFTGYFEPELNGSAAPIARYKHPVYAPPTDLPRPWPSRRMIESTDILHNRGLEIAWVDDPTALFFAQIQGSTRINMTDGSTIRLGYAAANGHDYKSIGLELIERGVLQPHQASAQAISNWVRSKPNDGRELLMHNPSYVFFRKIDRINGADGPLGAMNWPLTPLRSIAVDPEYVPLGAPVWVEKNGSLHLRRLMVAQDTGSAIKGAQRADIFVGTGDVAGQVAGQLKDSGRMVVLTPIQRAYAMLEELDE